MDSLSQIALGATVGAVIGGRKYGKKSLLIGGFCGTLPDMDVLLHFGDDSVTSFTEHRGFSHSILFAFFITPILAFLTAKLSFFSTHFKDKTLHALIFAAILTHALLDALTIYGTQLFWPHPSSPVSIGSIFIIDPMYTIPLIGAIGVYLINRSQKTILTGLVISSLYLVWGLSVQHHIRTLAKQQLPETHNQILVQATPFNTLLWRIVVLEADQYQVGYFSVFDQDKTINFTPYLRNTELLRSFKDKPEVSRLIWFSNGYYALKQQGQLIILQDLRMGSEPENYFFSFVISQDPAVQYPIDFSMGRFETIWNRIWRDFSK